MNLARGRGFKNAQGRDKGKLRKGVIGVEGGRRQTGRTTFTIRWRTMFSGVHVMLGSGRGVSQKDGEGRMLKEKVWGRM